jgi:hypothetical protein
MALSWAVTSGRSVCYTEGTRDGGVRVESFVRARAACVARLCAAAPTACSASGAMTTTPTVGADGSLRLVYEGRRLVLGPQQVQVLYALWQTAAGWLPRPSLPAVLAGIPFTPHRPPQLSSEQHTAVAASLRGLRTQGLIAPTERGRVALSPLGDALMHLLVAWAGWPEYWACIAGSTAREQGTGGTRLGSSAGVDLLAR